MTAQEKAKELVDKMYATQGPENGITEDEAKQCALIAVDEIISAYPHTYDIVKDKTKDNEDVTIIMRIRSNIGYWQEVKEEIEKL
jgi:hypothetical protein